MTVQLTLNESMFILFFATSVIYELSVIDEDYIIWSIKSNLYMKYHVTGYNIESIKATTESRYPCIFIFSGLL